MNIDITSDSTLNIDSAIDLIGDTDTGESPLTIEDLDGWLKSQHGKYRLRVDCSETYKEGTNHSFYPPSGGPLSITAHSLSDGELLSFNKYMEDNNRPSCTKSEIEIVLRDFMEGAMKPRGERSGQCQMKIEEWNERDYQPTFWWFDTIRGNSAIFKSVHTSSPISLEDFSGWLDSQTKFNFSVDCSRNTRENNNNALSTVVSEDMRASKSGFYPAVVSSAATDSFYKYMKAQGKTSDCLCDFSKNFKIFLVDLMRSKEEGKIGHCSATFTNRSYYDVFSANVEWQDHAKGDIINFVKKENT